MIMLIILVVHLFEIIDLLSWIVGCDCHYIFYTLIFTRRFRIATYSHRAVPSPHTHTHDWLVPVKTAHGHTLNLRKHSPK
jgi:hypothetical protein